MFDLFFRPRERSLIPSHWYRDPRPRFSPVFSFDPHFSYRRVIIRIIREIEGGKKEKERRTNQTKLVGECVRVSSYISAGRRTNEEKRERERERGRTLSLLRRHPSSPTFSPLSSSPLFIYPSTWTQRWDTEFANLLFPIWVCRALTTKLCPGKPRINDNTTTKNDNHYRRYRDPRKFP